ncbi:MAG: sigma-70 family RNA polymerase sigma factor [Thermoguttaceae bacterium]
MADSQQSDFTELIHKARQGDAACRERLFELCRGYLGLIARAQVESWLQARVDPSDLVQQTMLEAYRDFEHFQGDCQREWVAWLRRILAHNAADFVRRYRKAAKRQVLREIPFRDPRDTDAWGKGAEPMASQPTPSQELLQRDDQSQLAAALAQLPPDYQEVILLRNLERLPFDEVARRMDRSRPAAQMLWMRAIRKLRELLGAAEAAV